MWQVCTRVTEELHSVLSQSELSNFFVYIISLGIYSLCKEFTSTFSNTFPPRQKYNDPSLTCKFQSSRFLKANFLVAGFYCIHMLKVRSDVSIQRRGWVPLLFHLWAFDNPPSPWMMWPSPSSLPPVDPSTHLPFIHLSRNKPARWPNSEIIKKAVWTRDSLKRNVVTSGSQYYGSVAYTTLTGAITDADNWIHCLLYLYTVKNIRHIKK